jgi:hypothetical protein
MDEQNHLHSGGQEAERENTCTSCLSIFSPFIPYRFPASGMVVSTFREGLPSLNNHLWKCLGRHTKVCFTNLTGNSQSNQADHEDGCHRTECSAVRFASLLSLTCGVRFESVSATVAGVNLQSEIREVKGVGILTIVKQSVQRNSVFLVILSKVKVIFRRS